MKTLKSSIEDELIKISKKLDKNVTFDDVAIRIVKVVRGYLSRTLE